MTDALILASGSEIRRLLLERAGVPVETYPARVDETSMRAALEAEGASPRDVADALADMKARRVAEKHPGRLVLGCDQVLARDREIFGKPETVEEAASQLRALRGRGHQLLSAAVIYDSGKPVWRHVSVARLHMRDFSDTYLEDYLSRNWDDIRLSVGGYKLEEEGIRLFTRIEGDYFTILGLPLLELLNYLTLRGTLPQ
jgi:septum formation protein